MQPVPAEQSVFRLPNLTIQRFPFVNYNSMWCRYVVRGFLVFGGSATFPVFSFERSASLTGLALMALYRICAESAHRDDPPGMDALVIDINQAAARLRDYAAPLYDELLTYVSFHLTRTRPKPTVEQPDPDFHQLLGILNQYPALLRPLGLVYDFQIELSAALTGDPLVASVVPPAVAGVTPEPLSTACTKDFFAASNASKLHVGRFLNLKLKSGTEAVYEIVTEDADGSAHKLAHQATSQARSAEYQASAPPRDNGLGLPAESHIPSARTAGIVLYQINRAPALGNQIAATPPIAAPPPIFYLEDLTLGYRVDVKGESWPSWMSLHERESSYDVGGKTWKPSGTSLAPDEGFLTMAVEIAQPAAAQANQDLRLFVHQSLATWLGWSLSVPRKEVAIDKSKAEKVVIAVHPTYRLRSMQSLPKLRYDTLYILRLRHVDLAGNSLAVGATSEEGADLRMATPFSRHEPVRAPQILLEEVIDRKGNPGEQADRMVVRDHGSRTQRMLVPPRETRQVLEFHGSIESESLPDSAFRELQLMENGTFPSVCQAAKNDWLRAPSDLDKHSAEYQDAIVFRRQGDRPTVPYLPDPLARFMRIEPFVLQQDLSKYVPWQLDKDIVNSGVAVPQAYYLDSQWVQKWPRASPIRVIARPASPGTLPKIQQGWMTRDLPGSLPTVPVLYVDIPEGWVVALRLTSATCLEPASAEVRSKILENMSLGAPNNGQVIPDKLPQGGAVNLWHAFRTRLGPTPAPLRAMVVAAGGDGPAVRDAAAVALAGPPQGPLQSQLRTLMNLIPKVVRDNDVRDRAIPDQNFDADIFVCGTTRYVTPPRVLTLVHAVKQPVTAPALAEPKPGIDSFSVIRALGAPEAAFEARVMAHWLSTGKVTCHAEWTDTIDDPTKSAPQTVPGSDVLEFLNRGGGEPDGKLTAGVRTLSAVEHFRTTRAHKVNYSFSATTRFREYYAEDQSPVKFTRTGTLPIIYDVLSSVAPPEPSVEYIVPAYSWQDAWNATTKTWKRGRTMVMRVYLQRPFLVSGDEECLGVVLGNPQSVGTTVTEWGRDPIVQSQQALASSRMKATDFAVGTAVPGCFVGPPPAAGGSPITVDVLPFPVEFSKDRNRWFCDIPFSPTQTPSAFVRLALVRWQPKALHASTYDVRLSTLVVADFLQLGPDRWVSVKKIKSKQYSVTVSGVFRTPLVDGSGVESKEPTITYAIEQKWHQVGRDMGWRPVGAHATKFRYSDITLPASPTPGTPPVKTGEWTAIIDLPGSSSLTKYRLLLTEQEWLDARPARLPIVSGLARSACARSRVRKPIDPARRPLPHLDSR